MDALKQYVAACNLPRSEIARRLGLSRPHLHALENGLRQPSPAVAVKIARATNGAVGVETWPAFRPLFDHARLNNAEPADAATDAAPCAVGETLPFTTPPQAGETE